jgi:inorganic pyrophosphatase
VTGLPPFDEGSGDLNAIIETTQGSRNKFTFDERRALYFLSGVLPAGASFPYDFGFVPSTLGDDGDPLDVLVLMDEPAFVGCLVPSRLVGVITATQQEGDDPPERNDRLIAVAAASRTHEGIRTLADLAAPLLEEIEHFFVSYNEIKGKRFEPLERKGPRAAATLVHEGAARHAAKAKGAARRKRASRTGRKTR